MKKTRNSFERDPRNLVNFCPRNLWEKTVREILFLIVLDSHSLCYIRKRVISLMCSQYNSLPTSEMIKIWFQKVKKKFKEP